MMRWKRILVALAVTFAGICGCKQQCFLMECDLQHYQELGLPARVECDPTAPIQPQVHMVAPPPTVVDPERPPRFLTLAEAIAIALENGRIGNGNTTTLSLGVAPSAFSQLNLTAGHGGSSQTFEGLTPDIRVLRLDPAKFGSDIEQALSKFDAQWQTTLSWNTTDNAVSGSFINQFQPNSESASFRTSLLKPLPTGGVAGITWDTNYRLLGAPQGNVPNPSYTTDLQFQFEQPLLQGFGIEINQLRPNHPGTINPFGLATSIGSFTNVEGILVTRIRFDQDRAHFENLVQEMVLAVKQSYWNLYGAYWNLYAQEQALRQSYEAWKINKARFEAGRIPVQDFAQTRQQYEQFRSARLSALGQVLENERGLREILGLPVEDCSRLVPIDEPTLTPYQPDWCAALNEALALRPPLVVQREELKAKLFNVMLQKNSLLPDLRSFATYGLNGIGSRLDGPDDNVNALRSLATDRFTNWALGLRLSVPLGYRAQHAQLRNARLQLAQQYMLLRDYEGRATHFLSQEYGAVIAAHAQIEINRSQRIAASEQLEARFKNYLAGVGTLDILLESQRVWASALQQEYQSIVLYNNALVSFEFAKGTILQDENVHIAEGPLPGCAAERAVDHLKERTKALVLRQRAAPEINGSCCGNEGPGVPHMTSTAAPVSTLPFLEQNPPSLPAPEALPSPKPSGSSGVSADPLKAVPLANKLDVTNPTPRVSSRQVTPSMVDRGPNSLPGVPILRPNTVPGMGVVTFDQPTPTTSAPTQRMGVVTFDPPAPTTTTSTQRMGVVTFDPPTPTTSTPAQR
jgi:outer membrane protein TolC